MSAGVSVDYVKLIGGIDLVSSPLSASPGSLIDCVNYECGNLGGYRRVDGYERFDGQPAPSDATYITVPIAIAGDVVVGDEVSGVTSGATGYVAAVQGNTALTLTMVSGSFLSGESLTDLTNGKLIGVTDDPSREITVEGDAVALAAAADIYRSKIKAPPGSGPIRGLFQLRGTLYAWRDNETASVCQLWASSPTGWTQIVLGVTQAAGGRYEHIVYNFGGALDQLAAYGCDGKNSAFKFDGNSFQPISTGMLDDRPEHIAAHKRMLFLSFGASLQNSGINSPLDWTVATGANEIAIGDQITALVPQTGDALAIFARNSSWLLQGSSIQNFVLSNLSPDTGAVPYSAQRIGQTYILDDQGIISIAAAQAYGNFAQSSISRKVQPLVNALRDKVTCSAVYRSRNQYRLYGSNGSGLIVTMESNKVVGITTISTPVAFSCAWVGDDDGGLDVIFLGGADGMVYQANRGTSFDGQSIKAWLRMMYNSSRSPRIRKRYRKVVIEMTGVGFSRLRFQPDFSYSDPDVSSHPVQFAEMSGGGAFWDAVNWDEFVWDASVISMPEYSIAGTGINVAFMFYSDSTIDAGHTLFGLMVHHTERRLQR